MIVVLLGVSFIGLISQMKNKIFTIIFSSLLLVTTIAFILTLNIWGSQSEISSSRLYFLEKKINAIDLTCMTYPESEGMSEIRNEIEFVLPLIKNIREERKLDYSLSYIYVIFLISITGLIFNYKYK